MKVPEDKTVPARVGWVERKRCRGWRAWVDCGFWGHKRRVQLHWTCSRLGKATLKSVPQPLLPAQKNEPLSRQCAECLPPFPSEIQSNWVWIFSSKMAPSSITHYKPHDSFHCAILNLTRLHWIVQAPLFTLESVCRDRREGPSTRGPLNYSIMVTHTCRGADTWDPEPSS